MEVVPLVLVMCLWNLSFQMRIFVCVNQVLGYGLGLGKWNLSFLKIIFVLGSCGFVDSFIFVGPEFSKNLLLFDELILNSLLLVEPELSK